MVTLFEMKISHTDIFCRNLFAVIERDPNWPKQRELNPRQPKQTSLAANFMSKFSLYNVYSIHGIAQGLPPVLFSTGGFIILDAVS